MARRHVTVDGFMLVVDSDDARVYVRPYLSRTLNCRAMAEYVEHDVLPEMTWYLNEVFVSPDERCRGLGSALVKATMTEIRRRGGKTVLVEPGGFGSDPKRLATFYGRLGFNKFRRGSAKFLATNTLVRHLGVPTKHEVPTAPRDLVGRHLRTGRKVEADHRRLQ